MNRLIVCLAVAVPVADVQRFQIARVIKFSEAVRSSHNGRKHLERTAGARRRNARIVRGIRRQIHLGIVGVCVVRGIRNKRSHFAVCIQNCDAAHDVVLFEVGIDVVLQLRI